jgi:hypothetical protein
MEGMMRGISGCLAAVAAVFLFGGELASADDSESDPKNAFNSILARYDEGFRFETSNGAFSLRLNGLLQARWTYVDYDREIRFNQSDYSNTYLRRARLYFSGAAGSPRFTYLFHVQLEPNQGINANDLWIEYRFSDLLRLGAGRNKIAYGLEMLNSGSALGMVERSLMYGETDIDVGQASEPGPRYPGGGTARFGLSSSAPDTGFSTGGLHLYRSQGIQLRGQKGSADRPTFEYQLGFWQGRGSSANANYGNDHLVSLRVGYHPFGFVDWRFVGDLEDTDRLKLAITGSVYADTSDSPVIFDERGYNLAVLARLSGWSVDLEWGTELYDYEAYDDDFEREGFRASLGWFIIPSTWEIRARYAEIQRLKDPTYQKAVSSGLGVPEIADGDGWTPAVEARISEISVAASVFIPAWRNRLIVDVSRLVRSFAADPGAVIDGEPAPIIKAPDQVDYRIRTMVQLVF